MTNKSENPLKPLLTSLGSALAPQGATGKSSKKTKRSRRGNKQSQSLDVKAWAAPAASSAVIRTPNNMRYKCTTFEREEALGPIVGNTAPFSIAGNYPVNPGLSSTFPWMYMSALAFNMYKFRKLRIHYKNSTSTNNTGVVVIGFNPDPNDIAPATLAQIENYETRVRVATWEDSYVDVPKEDLARLKKFFVRSSIVPGEIGTYDLGTIFIGVSGNNSNTATLGEVWLEYILDMYAPITAVQQAPYAKANSIYTQSTSVPVGSGSAVTIPWNVTLANPMGLVNTAGSFTGITGALIVYTQVTIGTTAFTSGNLSIVKNGATAITAVYPGPQPTAASGFSSMNVEGYVVLLPTDVLTVTVTLTGNGSAVPTANTTAILVLTAA